jgi:formate dehydrogenase maturation protein FdhE
MRLLRSTHVYKEHFEELGVKIENKASNEKIQMIEQLEEEDKQAIYRIIDGMLTKSKFKDFFNKNVAIL